VTVLGTRADVPHQGLEEQIGQKIHWVNRDECKSWADLGLQVPDVFLHTGWAYPVFNALGYEVNRSGGLRISMIDTMWYGTLRHWMGRFWFRVRYRRKFDAVMVPGKEGRRFCGLMGMADDRILEGLYGADPRIFTPGTPLEERPKRILFVGRLITRKGVHTLLEAIQMFVSTAEGREWEFVIVGEGPLAAECRKIPQVRLEAFAAPEQIASWMRQSRFLVLPSLREHWGVVVHEAACSGCGMILTGKVGASADLTGPDNGFEVSSENSSALAQTFTTVTGWSPKHYAVCREASIKAASNFGPQRFAREIMTYLEYNLKPAGPEGDRS
jgi:glycosyltransferase involved in cell wall biosynthesis